jgi:ERCC4-type nuclease
MAAKAKLRIIRDTREQNGWDFASMPAVVADGTLATADYTVAGLESYIAIERKSLSDFIGSVTHERPRFEREMARLRAYRFRAVIIEADLGMILNRGYRQDVAPQAVIGTICSWQARYEIGFLLGGGRQGAQVLAFSFLRAAVRQIHEVAAAAAAAVVQTT